MSASSSGRSCSAEASFSVPTFGLIDPGLHFFKNKHVIKRSEVGRKAMFQKIKSRNVCSRDQNYTVDRLLRFKESLHREYECETGSERCANLREVIVVGLILFNIHNITDWFLLEDIYWIAIAARLFIVTPSALLAAIYLDQISADHRERIILSLVTGAYLIETFLFLKTKSSLGNYSFSQLSLTIIYGNMLLPLRFRHAVLFSGLSLGLACLIIWLKADLLNEIRFTLAVQTAMACTISLYANFKTERRRCRDYVVAHDASMRADEANLAKLAFQDQSRTDALTGLPNRRLLDEKLKEWFADDQTMAVMMIDIDHFKLFNDMLGHPAGDDCLKLIGRALSTVANNTNVLCTRFGGEEFVVIARSINEIEAARIADSIVKAVEALKICHPGRSDGTKVVTVSVGVAFKTKGILASLRDVTEEADKALYRAKRNGRNRYVFSERPGIMRVGQL